MGLFEFELRKRKSSFRASEDELTSRIFGILEIVGEEILIKWLKINNLKKIVYWPKYPGVDPDLSIYDQYGKELIVECKLYDKGTVNQIKREYNLAYNTLKGEFIFITANISRPDILNEAEKELGLKNSEIRWTTWMELYAIINDTLSNEDILPVKKYLLIQLKSYLRWLKMGFNFGELMEKYKAAYNEGWLEIVSEKFKSFLIEIKHAFEIEIEKNNLYKSIRVSVKIKSDLFSHTWINIFSEKVEKVNEKLYYFVYFDIK